MYARGREPRSVLVRAGATRLKSLREGPRVVTLSRCPRRRPTLFSLARARYKWVTSGTGIDDGGTERKMYDPPSDRHYALSVRRRRSPIVSRTAFRNSGFRVRDSFIFDFRETLNNGPRDVVITVALLSSLIVFHCDNTRYDNQRLMITFIAITRCCVRADSRVSSEQQCASKSITKILAFEFRDLYDDDETTTNGFISV